MSFRVTQASRGHCRYDFEVHPEKSFNRGFTDYFIHGRQPGIGSPDTPKSMGEYIGEVKWCNSVQMEIATDKMLHNGDGLCFLNGDGELVGIRADVVRNAMDAARNGMERYGKVWKGMDRVCTVSTNRPHGARRGYRIYRNYDLEWQKQVIASKGNRKMDIDLVLSETEEGYALGAKSEAFIVQDPHLSPFTFHFSLATPKIVATNPEKALENIRRKLMQWGDTVFNPVNLELQLAEPRLIPASVLGELKRGLVEQMKESLVAQHQDQRPRREALNASSASDVLYPLTELDYRGNVTNEMAAEFYRQHGVEEIEDALEKSFSKQPGLQLMTCHHCIRYANGMCFKNRPSYTGPLYLRHGDNTFRLEFDCRHCQMKIFSQ